MQNSKHWKFSAIGYKCRRFGVVYVKCITLLSITLFLCDVYNTRMIIQITAVCVLLCLQVELQTDCDATCISDLTVMAGEVMYL